MSISLLNDPSIAFLLVKMLVTATIVVGASLIAERTGPLLAAMVATLPVSAGPVYFFLALEHSDAFIAEAALGSVGSNFATLAFCVAYVMFAQSSGTVVSLLVAFSAWFPALLMFKTIALGAVSSTILGTVLFAAAHYGLKSVLRVLPSSKPSLEWYIIPLRAILVASLVGAVTTISLRIGPQWSGFFATFPIVLSTLILFLHPRMGGRATAAIIGSGIRGLMGFGLALALVHFTAVPLGKWWALGLGLAVCMIWNLSLVLWSRRR